MYYSRHYVQTTIFSKARIKDWPFKAKARNKDFKFVITGQLRTMPKDNVTEFSNH